MDKTVVSIMGDLNKLEAFLIIPNGLKGGAGHKRGHQETQDTSAKTAKGVPREEKLDELSRAMDKIFNELEAYTEGDELLHKIVTQVRADKQTALKDSKNCMSNVFKKLPCEVLENIEDSNCTNIFLTAQQIAKVIYREHYKEIKDYEDIYKTAKSLMENQVLFAMCLQFHTNLVLERSNMKTEIRQTIKDLSKAEGAAEASRMRD